MKVRFLLISVGFAWVVVTSARAQDPDQFTFDVVTTYKPGGVGAALYGSCSVLRVSDSTSVLRTCAQMGLNPSAVNPACAAGNGNSALGFAWISSLSDGRDVHFADGELRAVTIEFIEAGIVYRVVGSGSTGVGPYPVFDSSMDPLSGLMWGESDVGGDLEIFFTVDCVGAEQLGYATTDILRSTTPGQVGLHASLGGQGGLAGGTLITALSVAQTGEILIAVGPGSQTFEGSPLESGVLHPVQILPPSTGVLVGPPVPFPFLPRTAVVDGVRIRDPAVSGAEVGTVYPTTTSGGFLPFASNDGNARCTLTVNGRNGNFPRIVDLRSGSPLVLRTEDVPGAANYAIYGYIGALHPAIIGVLPVAFQPSGWIFPEMGNPHAFCLASTIPGQGAVLAPPLPSTTLVAWPAGMPEVTWRVAYAMSTPPLEGGTPGPYHHVALSNEITVRFF